MKLSYIGDTSHTDLQHLSPFSAQDKSPLSLRLLPPLTAFFAALALRHLTCPCPSLPPSPFSTHRRRQDKSPPSLRNKSLALRHPTYPRPSPLSLPPSPFFAHRRRQDKSPPSLLLPPLTDPRRVPHRPSPSPPDLPPPFAVVLVALPLLCTSSASSRHMRISIRPRASQGKACWLRATRKKPVA
jgi:hypothetical protein